MAGRRRRPESAYERRIRRYLDAHPGATRQEARGHRPPQGNSEYRERVARARRAHPGISRRAAGGHGSADERELARLLRLIRSQPRDVQVAFTSLGRRKDGTYERGRFDVLYIGAGGEPESEVFVIDAATLAPRMDEVADAISTYIGQGFLGWGSDGVPPDVHEYAFVRNDRYLRGFDRIGRALTSRDIDRAITRSNLGDAQDFYDRRLSKYRGRRRFMIEDIA